MKKYLPYGTILFLFFLILVTKGVFIPEVALSGECKSPTYQSSKTAVHMIELFTSEGCSSCPPAEKWLNSLYGKKTLWKEFVPLAFHVDYWDYIGWKDKMAKKEYSQRQRRYASEWKSNNVYTPGFVLNGKEWRNLLTRKVPKSNNNEVGILKAIPNSKNEFHISFTPIVDNKDGFIFSAALLGHGIANPIKRGENSGKVLKHNFVVLESKSLQAKKSIDGYSGTLTLSKSKIAAKEYGLAVWVSKRGSQQPLQVTGGCLNL
jgi:hypothetical protein